MRIRTVNGQFLYIGSFHGELLKMKKGSTLNSSTVIRKFIVALLQMPFQPLEKVADGWEFGTKSEVL